MINLFTVLSLVLTEDSDCRRSLAPLLLSLLVYFLVQQYFPNQQKQLFQQNCRTGKIKFQFKQGSHKI